MDEGMWWLTVAGYGITAVLCAICAHQQNTNKGEQTIWWGLAASMLVLGINKEQNLTELLTTLARQNARQSDWYSSRIGLQQLLIGVFLMGGFGLFLLLIRYRHTVNKLQWLAMSGVIFLLSFTLIRAVSLHEVDAFLYANLAGIQLYGIIELGGVALVMIPALMTLANKEEFSRLETGD